MNPKLVEEVARPIAELIAREVPCGQSPDAPADHPCKVTWMPYKRRCPECSLHHTQRADFANEIAQAAIRVCMARAAEIAISNRAPGAFIDYDEACTDIASAIKREGGLT